MQIISLNMQDTKMSQAEMNSTRKNTPESVEKSLVATNLMVSFKLTPDQPLLPW